MPTQKNIFEFADRFGYESPFGDWVTEEREKREEREKVRAGKMEFKPFEDYYVKINIKRKEIHFHILLYVNDKDERVMSGLSNLKSIWPESIVVPDIKMGSIDLSGWTLFFESKIEKISTLVDEILKRPQNAQLSKNELSNYPYHSINDENNKTDEECLDLVKKYAPYALFLNKDLTKEKEESVTEPNLMRLGKDAWNLDDEGVASCAYSHELGHTFFNDMNNVNFQKDFEKDFKIVSETFSSLYSAKKDYLLRMLPINIKSSYNYNNPKMKQEKQLVVEESSHYGFMNNFLPDGAIRKLPVEWRPPYTTVEGKIVLTANWDETKNPKDYGYDYPPLMSYTTERQRRSIWIYEYKELLYTTYNHAQRYLNFFSGTNSYNLKTLSTIYLKRLSRIAFWTND